MKLLKSTLLGLMLSTPALKAEEPVLAVAAVEAPSVEVPVAKDASAESLDLTIWGSMAKKAADTPGRKALLDLLSVEAVKAFAAADQLKAMVAGSVYASTLNADAVIGMWISQRNLYWINNVSCELWMSQIASYATETEIVFWTAALRQINNQEIPMLLELIKSVADVTVTA